MLDSHLLRTFLAVAKTGSVTGGADRVGRSQSAVSTQLAQLEYVLGGPVFERHSRGVQLNARGEAILPVAASVVAALDETLADIQGGGLRGSLRVGISDEHGRELMSRIVADFYRGHPGVELEVHAGLSAGFAAALAVGGLDVAIHEVETIAEGMTHLRDEPVHWVGAKRHILYNRDPLPVALFDQACWWRDVAIRALDESGRAYKIVYTSESMAGVAAAIEAGVAIGTLGGSFIDDDFEVLDRSIGLPRLPVSRLALEARAGADQDLVSAITEAATRAYSG